MQKIKIDIISDVVCPWCYIGKRRIEKAIETLKDKYDFEISFLPFELNAQVPKAGLEQKQYLTNKFGGNERYKQITQHVTAVAASEGLQFDFDKQQVMPNTRDAHRIIWLAKQTGKQALVKEAFMKAYFEDGVDLSKPENLITISVKAGLSEEKVTTLLTSAEGLHEVIAAEQLNQKRGVSGVPYFIINDQYGISGAQPTEVFVQALTQIGREVEAANACDVETKEC
ncbi:MAG TPA: DsbA family oxidoreductase [Cyclobacteriaceae bacterium]|nr:DsbA family oxidoreductase [Cyclobacteriaceae bacterium]